MHGWRCALNVDVWSTTECKGESVKRPDPSGCSTMYVRPRMVWVKIITPRSWRPGLSLCLDACLRSSGEARAFAPQG